MALKTAVRVLCKWLPQSPEMLDQMSKEDEREFAGFADVVDVSAVSGSRTDDLTRRLGADTDADAPPPVAQDRDAATQAALDAAKAKLGAGTPTDPDGLPADWATDERNAPPGSAPVEAEEA